MQEPAGAWVPKLQASLQRAPDDVHRSGEYVTTRYSVVPGQESVLEDGLADLVMFMYVAVVAAADNPSWRSGGLISARTWGRLLKVSDGERDNLKAYLGEVLAWWHEETSPAVTYAGRPSPSTSQPVIDSLSLLECGDGRVVRAVQAKATFGSPRSRCNEAFTKFARLQAGDYDEAWADAVRRFHLEVAGDPALAFDAAAIAVGRLLMHFCVSVGHRTVPPTDPVHDYPTRLRGDPPHGRAAALFHHAELDVLVEQIAQRIEARLP